MWQDANRVLSSVFSLYENAELDKLSKIYAAHKILHNSLPVEDFEPLKDWSSAVKFTDYGRNVLDQPRVKLHQPSDSVAAFACFDVFFHHDFIVDINSSALDDIISLTDKEIKRRSIRLPERFGRLLYDKFNDSAQIERPEYLDPQEVYRLIDNTEQGIYQIDALVTGPFGLLKSESKRFIPPTRMFPLWHCADTGCGKLHSVNLHRNQSRFSLLSSQIRKFLKQSEGPESDWDWAFAHIFSIKNMQHGREYYDLPALIADSILASDRRALLVGALQSKVGLFLRETLGQCHKNKGKGKAENIADELSESMQLQLLLTLSNEDLIRAIDETVWKRKIKISPSEIRKSKSSPPKLSTFDQTSTISMFGVRSNCQHPALFLCSTVWEEYGKAGQLEDLAWKCLKSAGSNTANPGIPIEFMMQHDPRKVVRELILPSRPIVTAVLKRLCLDFEDYANEDQFINRILWKFGFSPPRFEYKYDRLSSQLQQFQEELFRHDVDLTDSDRDSIRSRGVNVFVSLENFLEELISYNIWLLSSDHFLETKFVYDYSSSVQKVSNVLGKNVKSGDFDAAWNPSGGNVLSVLLIYARAAANWIQERTEHDKLSLKRSKDEMPHYVNENNQTFAFQHKELWADASPTQLRAFSEKFGILISELERSKIAEARNGLDHYREEDKFPSVEMLIACESRLSAIVRTADLHRFMPKIFWLSSKNIDDFGIVE